jgi:hypothetical protein
MLAPNALDTLSHALDDDSGIHIAYGHLDTFNDPNPERSRGGWPGEKFNWHGQIAHLNQLPYAAMMRREVLERSGGYRTRDWRAEDASAVDSAHLVRLSSGESDRREHADLPLPVRIASRRRGARIRTATATGQPGIPGAWLATHTTAARDPRASPAEPDRSCRSARRASRRARCARGQCCIIKSR